MTYTFTPTAEDWRLGLLMTRRHRFGRRGDIVKSLILLLVTLYCWIPFFWDGAREWSSFGVGLAALVILVALWVVPAVSLSREAAAIAAAGRPIHMTITPEGLGFGEGERYTELDFDDIRGRFSPELLALTLEGDQLLVLPRDALPAEAWECLLARLTLAPFRP